MYLKVVLVSIFLFVHIIDGRVPWRKGTLEEKPIQAIFDALPEEGKILFILDIIYNIIFNFYNL